MLAALYMFLSATNVTLRTTQEAMLGINNSYDALRFTRKSAYYSCYSASQSKISLLYTTVVQAI